MAGGREFDSGKFKELVLLMAHRSADDPKMSRVKLNKLLYLADFEAYRLLGRSITGVVYVKGERGPMASYLPIAEDELGSTGLLEYRIDESGQHPRKIPIAQEAADESLFSEEELKIAAGALEELADYSGWEASEWSHEESVGWNVVKEMEDPIPYSAAFISTDEIPPEDLERAKQFVRDSGWVTKAS